VWNSEIPNTSLINVSIPLPKWVAHRLNPRVSRMSRNKCLAGAGVGGREVKLNKSVNLWGKQN
jgi:hypothetical protein